MKTTMVFLCLLLIFLFSTTSCQTSEPVRRSPEYTSGRQLADKYAKRDVMGNSCSHNRGRVLAPVIRKHLDAMENEISSDFQTGFSDGYRIYYNQYVDAYCTR